MRTDVLPKNGSYILNLDSAENDGTHWVAVYNREYFDSYGLAPPEKLRNLKQVNRQKLQRKEYTCGHWACLYILLRSKGVSAYDVCYGWMRKV